ncbi:MAG: CBS domain-containing protein [Betaproteobacteria bacterium]|nr:CBS domain-containing protein [Betaproteobacteria bacterium]MDH3438093.1 CBS domain-containing protein [Betaproteobacteria bacterium]
MSTPAVTVRSDADYKAALKVMQENALHHLPVVDADGKLVGMAAERDLLLAATHYLQSAVEVGDIMHRGVVTVTSEMSVAEAATLMVEKRIGGLPVLDGGKQLIGIITETDMFRALVKSLDEPRAA